MSKQAQYEIELKNVEEQTLKEAVKTMAENLNLEVLDVKSFNAYGNRIPVRGTCIKAPNASYPVDVYARDGEVCINGDEMDLNRYKSYNDRIKQFYSATEVKKVFGSEIVYDPETEKIEMMVAV